MIEVSITIFPKEDKIDEIKEMLIHQCDLTLDKHKGCFTFIPSKSLKGDNTFYIKEKWYSARDLINYRNSADFLEYNENIKKLVRYDNIVESFEHM